MAETGTVGDFYDALIEGNDVAIQFENLGEYHTFRAKLYKYKAETEPTMLSMDIITCEQSLVIRRDIRKPNHSNAFIIKLVPKLDRNSKYIFEVIEKAIPDILQKG